MKEPLNNSLPKPQFTGKSLNHHPFWHNQPIRLAEEQKKDPWPVLEEFFQSYHLKDTREILWNWLSAVLTTPCSISGEAQDRDNHLFFYERVEVLIEVAFVLHKKRQKRQHKKEKRRLVKPTENYTL